MMIYAEEYPSVPEMTRQLLAAGWTRWTPRPKEPWYWCDPLGFERASWRLKDAYSLLRRRQKHGIPRARPFGGK